MRLVDEEVERMEAEIHRCNAEIRNTPFGDDDDEDRYSETKDEPVH